MARARFPPEVLKSGLRLGSDPRQTLLEALKRGPGALTADGRAIQAALTTGPRIGDANEDIASCCLFAEARTSA